MKTILLIEDDVSLALLLKSHLVKENYKVEIVGDGSEAVRMLEKSIPDLVIIDVIIQGINGLEVLRYLRKQLESDVPVIVYSCSTHEDFVIAAFEARASDFVSKPFAINEMMVRINQLMGSKSD